MRLVLPLLLLSGCCSVPPPLSRIPTGQAAIERMRATRAGCNGVFASGGLEVSKSFALLFKGSVKADVSYYGVLPSHVRLDVLSSFGAVPATISSDGDRFALFQGGRLYVGPARACAVERLTGVPVPPHALVAILRGDAPVLVHDRAEISWSRRGHYVVTIPSRHDAREEILLAPAPADWDKPWTEQRLRVVGVTVWQHDDVVYEAEMRDHAPAPMATAYVDPDGLDPPIPPSGPRCEVELPRAIHIEAGDEELDLHVRDVTWNPPYPEGVFAPVAPRGTQVIPMICEDSARAPSPAPSSATEVPLRSP